jgi:hypothetical protein
MRRFSRAWASQCRWVRVNFPRLPTHRQTSRGSSKGPDAWASQFIPERQSRMWEDQSASRAKTSSGPLKVLVANSCAFSRLHAKVAVSFRRADIFRLPGQPVADLLGGKIRLGRYGNEIQSTAGGAGSNAQFGRERAWTNPVQMVLETTFCSFARYWRTGVLYAAFAPTAPPQSKLRRSCSGSGRAGTFAGNSCCRPFLRWRQPTGVKVFASRQSIRPIGKPPLRQRDKPCSWEPGRCRFRGLGSRCHSLRAIRCSPQAA